MAAGRISVYWKPEWIKKVLSLDLNTDRESLIRTVCGCWKSESTPGKVCSAERLDQHRDSVVQVNRSGRASNFVRQNCQLVRDPLLARLAANAAGAVTAWRAWDRLDAWSTIRAALIWTRSLQLLDGAGLSAMNHCSCNAELGLQLFE